MTEQPIAPSADVQPSDGAAASTGSEEPKDEQTSGKLSWWDRLMGRREDQESSTESQDPSQQSSTSKTRTLTEEELQRFVQSEADRREAKRAADAKIAERKRLRDTDPFAYAEEERKQEQVQEGTSHIQGFLAKVGNEHDKVAIDPIVELLPKDSRERILGLEGAGVGLNGRKLVVSESLKELEKMWKAEGAKDAEARLRRNPAFRKQLLAESRGSAVEPDLLPGAGGSSADATVSALLRKHYSLG